MGVGGACNKDPTIQDSILRFPISQTLIWINTSCGKSPEAYSLLIYKTVNVGPEPQNLVRVTYSGPQITTLITIESPSLLSICMCLSTQTFQFEADTLMKDEHRCQLCEKLIWTQCIIINRIHTK